MAMVANDPKAAKRLGIKQSIGEEFLKADKGKKFSGGGMATNKLKNLFKGKESYAEEVKEAKAIKAGKITPAEYAKGEKMEEAKGMKKGGCVKMASGGKVGQLSKADGCAQRGKSRGKIV